MARIYIVRHAESSANAGGRSSDEASIPITTTGAQQARELAARLPEPSLIVTSRYARAAQTAAPLIARYPHVPVEIWAVEEFTHLDPSACAGTTYAGRKPLRDAYWHRSDPLWVDGPGCESFSDFIARARHFEDALRARSADEVVVVFTHGHFMHALLWLQQDPSGTMADFDRFRKEVIIPNCTVLLRTAAPADQSSLYITIPERSLG